MTGFAIRFFLCNLYISLLIGILTGLKYGLKNILTSRTQYQIWFLLFGILAVPFAPIKIMRFPHAFLSRLLAWLTFLGDTAASSTATGAGTLTMKPPAPAASWMNDFSVSISQNAPSSIGILLCALWMTGMFLTLLATIRTMYRFRIFHKSTLPLENRILYQLYLDCLNEMGIKRHIPIRTSAFLKSPVIAGFFKPCIYLPLGLIGDYPLKDIRYMLLHELQHYKHMDTLVNYLANVVSILYWFNPVVRYAIKEMRNDREIACDTAVLEMLGEDAYADYGHTLLNFTKEAAFAPFPFMTGISGGMKQMRKRIMNIASYRPSSFRRKLQNVLIYAIIVIFVLSVAPVLSIHAADDTYLFAGNRGNILSLDLEDVFRGYDGCFVLYDRAQDTWQIYNEEAAVTRIPPASTYKIYSALFALESGAITEESSLIPWDGTPYQYEQWNKDQTLITAMQDSVTWYFQALDQKTGYTAINDYIQQIGYGNQRIGNDISSYWLDSTLKISPIEQVESLQKLYDNQFDGFAFSEENMEAMKKTLLLSSDSQGTLYGKTGTIETGGENVCGWFIGYLEQEDNTYFFATNIHASEAATGPAAADLTLAILSDCHLWQID